MASRRVYRPSKMTVLELEVIRDYLNKKKSASLGQGWGHKIYQYTLDYGPDCVIECEGFSEVRQAC